jgi:ketosteroid isomerase-like protein
MGIDAEMAQRWLDAYSHAWLTYDLDEIGALFTDDAEYRWHPWDEGDTVARGRSQIVAAWLANRDRAGTYRGSYSPLLVHDDLAIAVGVSFYYTDATQRTLDRAYHNLWILRFTDEGQCHSFTEWYMPAPSAA